MVLGIVALAGTFVCGVLCVLGPFAWAMGARATREIDAEPHRWTGRSEAQIGKITGIIATMLLSLAVCAIALVFLLVAVGA